MSRPKEIQSECRQSLDSLIKSGKSKMSKEEAKKLLNYLLLFMMLDNRILLSDKIIQDFQKNESLLELIMTNWVDLISLKSIVSNVMVIRQPEFGGYYGHFRMTNLMFLDLIRNKLTEKTLKVLGIYKLTNHKVIHEMRIIAGFFNGKD
jgi:hypothetical protein